MCDRAGEPPRRGSASQAPRTPVAAGRSPPQDYRPRAVSTHIPEETAPSKGFGALCDRSGSPRGLMSSIARGRAQPLAAGRGPPQDRRARPTRPSGPRAQPRGNGSGVAFGARVRPSCKSPRGRLGAPGWRPAPGLTSQRHGPRNPPNASNRMGELVCGAAGPPKAFGKRIRSRARARAAVHTARRGQEALSPRAGPWR